ncbi:hepatitis A virus cellular receptor 1 homolog isoform X2 [Rana temporaria]|uniref:hepatitis A virus cellular receptor 1 homolog isoform X2 n=1 Tax=Rana temporaria TaxID=8407 RepID=UPI001AADC044|nr:hepatitis A virus cellular receptor 1 homolog isoform X2 [Rana temporaria]
MGPYCQWMFALILLLPGVLVSGEPEIWTVEDDTVTLQCIYSVDKGRTTMCWGRGDCTSVLTTYCNNVIIKTDGSTLTEKTSNRYQLLGNIEQGNVSLTITNVTKEDKGIYCCRVEISGWFNDKKNIYNVKVQERDKSDASTESNDRDKQEETSDPPVTEADDPLCSENHDDDTISYSSVNSNPMTPLKIRQKLRLHVSVLGQ